MISDLPDVVILMFFNVNISLSHSSKENLKLSILESERRYQVPTQSVENEEWLEMFEKHQIFCDNCPVSICVHIEPLLNTHTWPMLLQYNSPTEIICDELSDQQLVDS